MNQVQNPPPYSRILVFAAHPDDELAMAGTIVALRERGTEVFIVAVMNGSEGYPKPEWKHEIVAMRKREATACDAVLGVARRYHLDIPDMIGDGYTPERLKACIQIIREVRPEASFTHGPEDNHNDHRLVHRLSVDALWHAGEPVSSDLGVPWNTPFRYYYKGVSKHMLPSVRIDVSATAHFRFEAAATQESQFTLFRKDRNALLEEAQELKKSGRKVIEEFWLAEGNHFAEFPQLPRA